MTIRKDTGKKNPNTHSMRSSFALRVEHAAPDDLPAGGEVDPPMARTLRAEPSSLPIPSRFPAGAYALGQQAAATGSRPREQTRVYVGR